MSALASLPLAVLVSLFVVGFVLVAVAGVVGGRRWFRARELDAAAIATPLMPALGAAFAVLAAFAVADAAASLRDAEREVVREASAVARLAWASTALDDGGAEVQERLRSYVDATVADEWRDIDGISAGSGGAFDELHQLQRAVRSASASADLRPPEVTELLGAIDDISGARRSRFASAAPLATGVVVLMGLSGAALVLNASAITLGRDRRAAGVLAGLVVVVGLSIATAITLGAPFSGTFGASARPLADVATDLAERRFTVQP